MAQTTPTAVKSSLGWGMALVLATTALIATSAQAQELNRVPRPKANPAYRVEMAAAATPAAQAAAATAVAASAAALVLPPPARPKWRPAALESRVIAGRAAVAEPQGGIDLASLRPQSRSESADEEPPTPRRKSRATSSASSAKGSVCGVAAIKGENIAPITARVQGCGLQDGVRVTHVSGVRLSIPATIDCATAKALNTWVERGVQPAYGGRVVELKLAGHYVCRSRNNQKGAKVSEHGRGKAVDISGFVLDNGKTHMVLRGFDRTMRRAYKAACGIFGTTLGPGSDGYHEDHLHLDTAAHRKGSYCR